MCQLSRAPGIRRDFSKLVLCLLIAFVAGLGLSGCAGVTQQAPHASAQISVVPSSITFNNVTVGQKSSQTVQISNTGTASLNVTGISLTGSGFALSSIAVPFQLAPSASMNFTITFTASSTTSANATLTITSDAPNSPLSVAVQGTGQTASATLQISPASITFPSTTLQTTQTQNASLINNGNVSVTINSVNLTGSEFSISGLSSGTILSPSQQVNFQVLFVPTATGSATGSLSVSSTATPSVVTMNLAGSGATQHTVTLTWSPSTGATGYHVYRSTVSGGPYAILNPTPDTQTTYADATVQSGATYFYVATSLDSTGAESAYSNEASAVIPNP